MDGGSSLFRRALYRRITQSDDLSPPANAVNAAPTPMPTPKPALSPAPCAFVTGCYRVVGPASGIDLVDPHRRCALVVEDNDVLREGIAAMLDDEGWSVVEAESLDRARSLLSVVRPNVMLLDYDLRGEYASVLLDELTHARRAPPTVLVSACPLALDAARDYRLALLQKPFGAERLMQTIDDVLARRNASVPARVAR
jgi:CheY-like chemotaxis protein